MNNHKNDSRPTLVYNIDREDFIAYFDSLLEEIASIRNDIINKDVKKIDTLLTRKEVAEMLKCDISTVHNWTKSGKLKAYGVGGRVYYKLSEIEEAMIPLKRVSR